ncbi:MAG: segregation/condensation protein A [Clostridia bacterium]|nr:segregation/condensation protein A [Clostridia bacterium]
MDTMLYKLDSFEGPLDLLLHLISKNKVSIYDIPIVEITSQYLEAIEGIEESQLENTSEFLVMAAQLLYIKSKMLLPKNEEEEEEDPRDDLAQRLAEYQRYKEASQELRKSEFSSRYMFFKEEEKIDFPLPEYNRSHTVNELMDAFNSIMQRKLRNAKPEKRAFSGIVGREKVSVEEMADKLSGLLRKNKRLEFKKAFSGKKSKPELVATFLAILEMIRSSRIIAEYDEKTKDFILIKTKKEVNDE